MLLVDRIEAFKKASKEHETDKEELKKSVQEKEQIVDMLTVNLYSMADEEDPEYAR